MNEFVGFRGEPRKYRVPKPVSHLSPWHVEVDFVARSVEQQMAQEKGPTMFGTHDYLILSSAAISYALTRDGERLAGLQQRMKGLAENPKLHPQSQGFAEGIAVIADKFQTDERFEQPKPSLPRVHSLQVWETFVGLHNKLVEDREVGAPLKPGHFDRATSLATDIIYGEDHNTNRIFGKTADYSAYRLREFAQFSDDYARDAGRMLSLLFFTNRATGHILPEIVEESVMAEPVDNTTFYSGMVEPGASRITLLDVLRLQDIADYTADADDVWVDWNEVRGDASPELFHAPLRRTGLLSEVTQDAKKLVRPSEKGDEFITRFHPFD